MPSDITGRTRLRGRPRLPVDKEKIADAVAELYSEGGIQEVSIARTAELLDVSRATLYRMVASKEHLVGILLERDTLELSARATAIARTIDDPGERLTALVELQIDAAIRMRRHLPVFFGRGDLPPEAFKHWRTWSRDYEDIWVEVVTENMTERLLPTADAVVVARMLLGSCIWVSRWYRSDGTHTATQITDTAVELVRTLQGAHRSCAAGPGRASPSSCAADS